MYCPFCGAKQNEGARTCPQCGAIFPAVLLEPVKRSNTLGVDGTPVVKFRSFLIWNILVAMICSLPIGLVGVYFSSQARGAWKRGAISLALDRARWAETFFWIAAAFGCVFMFVETIRIAPTVWDNIMSMQTPITTFPTL